MHLQATMVKSTLMTALVVSLLFLAKLAPASDDWWRVSGGLDYTPHGTQPGLAHALLFSDNCSGCHSTGNAAQTQFFPFSSWAGSMMANASRDPVFWAALDVANHDQPGVGDYCLRCHTPKGWYGGRVAKDGTGGTVAGTNGCFLQGDYDDHDTGSNDYSGESCHFCHRLKAQGPSGAPAYLENANVWLDDGDCSGGEPCRRGPYDYVAAVPPPPPHVWAYSPYHQQSEICGTCHNVSTPDTSAGPFKTLIDSGGHDTLIPFPIERTFSEWRASDFSDVVFRDRLGDPFPFTPALTRSQQCQDCHMPNSNDAAARPCSADNPGDRTGNLATHQFAGGNTWVPALLKGQYGGLTQLNRSAAFDQTITWTQQMLRASASVAVNVLTYTPPSGGASGSLNLNVRVTNLSGHKLPTGYSEGRRMWINLQVRDNTGALVYESGAYDASTGVLTRDTQAQVYEVRQGEWDAIGMTCTISDGSGDRFHFALNNCIAKDNRIPPLGFTGGSDLELQPVAATYPPVTPGSNHLVNYADAGYTMAVPISAVPPLTITATLRYQTASKEYIEFLRNEAVTNSFPAENTMCSGQSNRPFTVGPQNSSRGQYLYDLWNTPAYGKSPPEDMGSAMVVVGS